MRLSPLDIRQQQFSARFRGFDRNEVETFLDDVADDYEALLKENALLKEQLAALEERSRGLADREKTLRDTLLTTQKLADEMKEAARRDAQLIVREAELRGDKILEEGRGEEARIRSDIKNLKRAHRQLVEDLRSTLDRYQRLFLTELPPDSGDDSPSP